MDVSTVGIGEDYCVLFPLAYPSVSSASISAFLFLNIKPIK